MSVICLLLIICLLLQQSQARLPIIPRNLLTTFKPAVTSREQHYSIAYIDGRNMKDRANSILEMRGGSAPSFLSGFVYRTIQTIEDILTPFIPKSLKKYLFIKRYGKNSLKSKTSTMINTSTDKNSRVQKEMQDFLLNPPENCRLLRKTRNIRSWEVEITGVNGTIYEGEIYHLKIIFSKDYPSRPPSVYFLKPCPKHVHVYTNGDICLNFLGRDWRPTMTAQMLVASILSMLSSAKEKKIPQDNALHADTNPGQQQNWMYHDDKC